MGALLIPVLGAVIALAKATSTFSVRDESGHGVCSAGHRSTVGAVSFLQSGFASSTRWNLQQQVAAPHELANIHPRTSANESTPDNIGFRHASNSSSADFVDLAVLVPNASSDGADNSSLQTVRQADSVKQESSNISSSDFVDVVVVEPLANASFADQSVTDSTSQGEALHTLSDIHSRQAYDESNADVNATGLVTDNSTLLLVGADEGSDSFIWELGARFRSLFWNPDAARGEGERLKEKKRRAVKAENYDEAKRLKADIEALHAGPGTSKPDGKHDKGHSSDRILAGVLFAMFFVKMMAWV